jgi:hypothetical protein
MSKRDVVAEDGHEEEHFEDGCCVCECAKCSLDVNTCVCPRCDAVACGMHPDTETAAAADPYLAVDKAWEADYQKAVEEGLAAKAKIRALTAENDALQAQVARVEALHHADGDGDCTECGTDVYDEPIGWPCGTIRALTDPTEGGASE